MAWVCARKATAADHEILNECAQAFINRHDLEKDFENLIFSESASRWNDLEELLETMVETTYWNQEWKYLRKLWRRIFARATKCPGCTGMGWGNIGYWVKD